MGEEERGLRCAPMNRHDAPVSEISLPFKITKFHTALPIDFGFEVSSPFFDRWTQGCGAETRGEGKKEIGGGEKHDFQHQHDLLTGRI